MKKIFLKLLSIFYGIGVSIRNKMFDLKILKSTEFNIPIISVGNITVGGTGKTPHTEYLVELLQDEFTIATLSRGYKRKSKGFLIVNKDSKVSEVGDEPLQIKKKFETTTVAVDEKRVHGIEMLLEFPKTERPDVVILDDAFQHRYVNHDINILLTDYSNLITNDSLLPYGKLREPAANRNRANIIIVTKCPEKLQPIDERIITKELHIWPYQNLYFTSLVHQKITPVFANYAQNIDEKLLANFTILLITGIANPKPLVEHLQSITANFHHLQFSDHHNFESKDLEKIEQKFTSIDTENKIIITTEKDKVRFECAEKISELIINNLYYIPLKIAFLNNEAKNFNTKILKYVRENKSNFDLHKRNNKI